VPGTSTGRSRKRIAPAVGGLFFPQSQSLGIDRSRYSPALQAKITFAGANNTSFAQAEQDLRALAEIDVSDQQTRRVCQAIGAARVAERDAAVADYLNQPLAERKGVPAGVTAPAVAVVGVDGGRLQIFERGATAPATAEPIEDDVALPEPVVPKRRPAHWREDKIGLLLTMTSACHTTDPCPEVPAAFVDPTWVPELTKELNKRGPPKGAVDEGAGTAPEAAAAPAPWQPPEVATKALVGTRRPWAAFGPMVATRAWALGFYGAPRQAFLGDGAENNWTLWRDYFSSFEPILDFIHALSYVFHAALAGRTAAEGWPVYVRWIGWVWAGEVEQVIVELAQRQVELGPAPAEAKETHPTQVVGRALGYLQNHKGRMRYAAYRRQGLPIVSSYVESAVKQFNYRVKGTEKFWREQGAEALLQLRGDYLSDGQPMEAFWERRQATESGQARYRVAV
jgi:hypothetical protein